MQILVMLEYRNVVLLSIDALRKDRVNNGYERDVAPFLDKLARENTEFVNCISTSSHTREAMSSMLTGVHPYRANSSGLMPQNAPGGGFHLSEKTIASWVDVRSGGFHSNPFLSRAFGYGRGWEKLDDDLYLGNNKIITLLKRFFDKLFNRHYARAEEINSKSLNWLDRKDPFFLWNHYMDPHGPYQPPEDYQGLYQDEPVSNRKSQKVLKKAINRPEEITKDEQQSLIDLYDEEIRYTDDAIKSLFEAIESRGLLDDTLVIIVGDHGESFGEDGFYEHGEALTETLVRVPLILVDGKQRTVETPVSVMDVATTVVNQLEGESSSMDGVDLLDIADNPSRYSDRTVFSQDTKDRHLLFGGFDGDSFLTFSPDTGEDLAPEEHEGLEKAVREYAEKALQSSGEDEEEEMEEEVKDRLEALGYLEDKSR